MTHSDPQSSAHVDFIGRTRTAHPDFGPPPYGIPYVGVGRLQPRVPVTFVDYGSESDSGFAGESGYGLIVADNGSDMYVTGAMDPRWNNDELNPAFGSLTAGDFDVITLGWR